MSNLTMLSTNNKSLAILKWTQCFLYYCKLKKKKKHLCLLILEGLTVYYLTLNASITSKVVCFLVC